MPENASRKSEVQNDPGALYQKWSNSVSPVNYFWREEDIITLSDGTTEEVDLIVTYHKTISPILAKWLVWDYYREDKSTKIKSEVQKLSGYDIDFGLYYHNWNFKVVIAQKGNKIIKAEFIPFDFLSDEEAIEIICKNF